MKWRFINTGENTGKFNMAFDLLLTKVCRPDEAFLRLYKWKPYCISLGANQLPQSINSSKAISNNIDIVTRPTGGRAILHSEEITYSVVLPLNIDTSVRNIYHEVNVALKLGLGKYEPELESIELEGAQPNFQSFYKEEKSAVCFAVPAKSELKYAGKKLVGSAQRKLGNIVLQHGSVLCGSYHKNIIDYLNLPESKYNSVKSDIENTTIELDSIIKKDVNYSRLADSLLSGFEDYFNIKFENADTAYLMSMTEGSDIFV